MYVACALFYGYVLYARALLAGSAFASFGELFHLTLHFYVFYLYMEPWYFVPAVWITSIVIAWVITRICLDSQKKSVKTTPNQ